MTLRPILAVILLTALSASRLAAGVFTLEQAWTLSLQSDPAIERLQAQAELARLEEAALLAETDPEFFGAYQTIEDKSPNPAPAIFGSKTETSMVSGGVRGKLLTATQGSLVFKSEETDNNSIFRTINPMTISSLNLEVRQPLLKHFWGRPDKALRRAARHRHQAALAALMRSKEAVAVRTASYYLDCYLGSKAIELKDQARQEAAKLLSKQKEKQGYGIVERSDVLQAETSLALRDLESTQAKDARDLACAQLAITLGSKTPMPIDSLVLPDLPENGLVRAREELLASALQDRYDAKAAALSTEAQRQDLRSTKLENLPDLSVMASLGYAGLDASRAASLKALDDYNKNVFTAGISFSIPFAHARERTRKKGALQRLALAQAALADTQRTIVQEVSAALYTLEMARHKKQAAADILDLQRRKYAEEEKNFQRARSTTDMLIRFQLDVNDAQALTLAASVEEAKALISLAAATGKLSGILDHDGAH